MSHPPINPARCQFAGCIDFDLDDEDFAPHGRRLELRVHYSWTDYDRADEPHAQWGPTIEAAEVVAVFEYDADGNEVPARLAAGEIGKDVASDLVQANADRVLDACREDGYRTAAGESPPWYYPAKQKATGAARVEPRLSRSIATRQAAAHQRFG